MKHHRKIIYIVGFIFTLPVALTSYINSSFLEVYINPYYVSLLYILASTITILGMLQIPHILAKLGNRSTALISSLLASISLVLLAVSGSKIVVILAFIAFFILTNFIIASLDIFMEDFSKHSSIGRFRGFYITILSSAWVVAQVISGSVINNSSFGRVYLISASFMLIFFIIFLFTLHDFKDPRYTKIPIRKTLRIFIRNSHLSRIYIINLILKFFFAWMIIYSPIYLSQHLGFAWNQIGIIFTVMLLPFILLPFPLGKLSDRIGEKKMLLYGLLLCATFTLLMPFITLQEVWIWAAVLFMTRVGASTVEIMSESYFFKYIKEEDADEVSFFRNTTPVSFVIAPIVALPVLYFTPSYGYIFFILGAVLLLGFFIALRLRDVK